MEKVFAISGVQFVKHVFQAKPYILIACGRNIQWKIM